jgi:hypothetical protein
VRTWREALSWQGRVVVELELELVLVRVRVLAVFVEKKRRAESWVVCHDAPVTVPAYLA